MSDVDNSEIAAEWLAGVESNEVKAFSPGEMLKCKECSRATPPTRLKCMYCGADVPVPPDRAGVLRPSLRKLEHWESGHNVIFIGKRPEGDIDFENSAQILRMDPDVLSSIIETGVPLPLARAETALEASALVDQLLRQGFECCVISDDQLRFTEPPVRLRGMQFSDDAISLQTFNTDQLVRQTPEHIELLVLGLSIQKTVETSEALKLKKNTAKAQGASETASDELVLDIFVKDEPMGYRVETHGFDFSCLGAEKQLLARQNIERLAEKLAGISGAKLDRSYRELRAQLGTVWPLDEVSDSKGVQREGLGTFKRKTTISISNLGQFTKYARLRRHLLGTDRDL
jgi:hypothetical protein